MPDTATATVASPTVHQAIAQIIGEMGGIGKNQRNREQNYNFRGIDDVLKVLHPLLAKHGVFFAPDVVERIYEERVSKSGTVGHCAHLHVRYWIYGPGGDCINVSGWGEGLDYGDKATNKAMTAAFKYVLFQVFAVADPEDDADGTTPEAESRTNASQNEGSVTGSVTQTAQGFVVAFNGEGAKWDACRMSVKAIDGAKWDNTSKSWRVPLDGRDKVAEVYKTFGLEFRGAA